MGNDWKNPALYKSILERKDTQMYWTIVDDHVLKLLLVEINLHSNSMVV
jgi:hypothetical protein